MAKKSIGGALLFGAVQLALAGYKSYRKERAELVRKYSEELSKSLELHKVKQAAYEAKILKFPILSREEARLVPVDTSRGDTDALEAFHQYLSINNQLTEPITAVLTSSEFSEHSVYDVELSDAMVGQVSTPNPDSDLGDLIRNCGAVRCFAYFSDKYDPRQLEIAVSTQVARSETLPEDEGIEHEI